MIDEKRSKILDASKSDIVHATIKGAISTIPIAGGALAEIFNLVFAPSISKRLESWIQEIEEKLLILSNRIETFSIEKLSENEMFISTVLQATQIRLRNHRKIKIDALRNAVLNTAINKTPDEDIQEMFVNLIDSFTSWHLRILYYLGSNQSWKGERTDSIYASRRRTYEEFLFQEFPVLASNKDFCSIIFNDLFNANLVKMNFGSFRGSSTNGYDISPNTTKIGNQFLEFITSPIDND